MIKISMQYFGGRGSSWGEATTAVFKVGNYKGDFIDAKAGAQGIGKVHDFMNKITNSPVNLFYGPADKNSHTYRQDLEIGGKEAGYIEYIVSRAPKFQKVGGKTVENKYDTDIRIDSFTFDGKSYSLLEQRTFNVDGKDASKFTISYGTNSSSIENAINSMKSNLVDEVKKKKI